VKRAQHNWNLINDLFQRLDDLKNKIGEKEYDASVGAMRQRLVKTYKLDRIEDHKVAFKQAIAKPHQPSAKEQERGFDVAPIIQKKVQYGKVHTTRGNNKALLRQECKGRYSDQALYPTPRPKGGEEHPEDVDSMGITAVKAWIKMDEKKRNPDETAEAEKFFEPLFTSFDDYEFDEITKL
jgi:hypothetical protein